MTKPVKRAGNKPVARQFIPSVKAPRVYKGTLDRIAIPKAVNTSYRKLFDWNNDGYVQGSYERYKVWSLVVRLFTKYQNFRTSAKYARDPSLRREVMRMKKDLRALFKIYKHLPQVNVKRQTVRIGNRVMPIHSNGKKVSASVLFAFGEALSAVPRAIRSLLFKYGKGFGSLELHVTSYRPRKAYLHNGGVHFFKQYAEHKIVTSPTSVKINTWTKRVLGIRGLKVRRQISTINSGYDIRNRIFSLKHEIGHAIEYLLYFHRLRDKKCVIKARGYKGHLPCRDVFFVQIKLTDRQISTLPTFKKMWLRKLKKAGVTAKMVRQFDRGKRVPSSKQRRLINRYLLNVHAASDPSEFFADSWAAFSTFKSPWSLKDKRISSRKNLKRVSASYYELFSRLSWGGLRAVTDIIGR